MKVYDLIDKARGLTPAFEMVSSTDPHIEDAIATWDLDGVASLPSSTPRRLVLELTNAKALELNEFIKAVFRAGVATGAEMAGHEFLQVAEAFLPKD